MSAARYRARPWRSRFLRAPAIALRIAQRQGFLPLGEIANVSLGLKTGADAFFFLRASEPLNASELGRKRSRTSVQVKGLSWEGKLEKGDLRGALLNPHRLQDKRGRRFVVPNRSQDVYLFPQDVPPRAGLADYLVAGEREGLPKRPLVKANATEKRWDRQSRPPIDWRWVLPYNSAYDYGAHDNKARLVLNGRFVGCHAKEDVPEELLGAALNSTFVILTRLLEGTATGSEGAYDVGPPAARLMRVPDPRALESDGDEILEALGAWRDEGHIPPAPDRAGRVSPARRSLDELILRALGESKGEAAYLLEECYAAYGRWRSAVEDVENRVRENRRTLAMSGRERSDNPVDLVARQVWDELSVDLPLLPSGSPVSLGPVETVPVAASFRAPRHEPMFGAGEIQAPNGESIDLGSFARVRYVDMLLRLGFHPPLLVPVDAQIAAQIADLYEQTLARIDKEAMALAKSTIGDDATHEVADAVIRMWRHACHSAGGGQPF